jgi:DNA invertase Pin-like site-specific DNA recombinase
MEVPKGQEWVFEMIHNVLIEVLASIAEQEWTKTKQRREEGIAAMPIVDGRKVSSRTGRGFGRVEKKVDLELLDGENVSEACVRLGISRTTYYRKLNSCRA